jgi:protein phosphatase
MSTAQSAKKSKSHSTGFFLKLPQLVKEALSASAADFTELLEKTINLLHMEKGRVGNFSVNQGLVTLEPLGEALVIGDLHGDLESLKLILKKSRFIEKLEHSKETSLIFLGDYGDRGAYSAEVYYVVLKLKLAFPRQVVLLRGNHEAPNELLGLPHDLPAQFKKRFGQDWTTVYGKMLDLFACLYNAVYVPERYLMVHGGVSEKILSIQTIAQAQKGKNMAVLEDLLWSDPDEQIQGVAPSPRGAGQLFGKDVTEKILAQLNVKVLIRGHEACDLGFKVNHDGKVLTLFSRKGAPYHNKYGAYLQLPLDKKICTADELATFIQKF